MSIDIMLDAMKDLDGLYNSFIEDCAPCGKILSVGDSARDHAILNMPYFLENKKDIVSEGINIAPGDCGTFNHFTIKLGDANNMPQYSDEEFDCVISVMMFEHNPKFWLALSEMRRILKKNGSLIVIVPGYTFLHTVNPTEDWPDDHPGAVTYGVHGAPCDYYRFSEYFMKQVVFENYKHVRVSQVKCPPRLLGFGHK